MAYVRDSSSSAGDGSPPGCRSFQNAATVLITAVLCRPSCFLFKEIAPLDRRVQIDALDNVVVRLHQAVRGESVLSREQPAALRRDSPAGHISVEPVDHRHVITNATVSAQRLTQRVRLKRGVIEVHLPICQRVVSNTPNYHCCVEDRSKSHWDGVAPIRRKIEEGSPLSFADNPKAHSRLLDFRCVKIPVRGEQQWFLPLPPISAPKHTRTLFHAVEHPLLYVPS